VQALAAAMPAIEIAPRADARTLSAIAAPRLAVRAGGGRG
jgi:hypothetical protein